MLRNLFSRVQTGVASLAAEQGMNWITGITRSPNPRIASVLFDFAANNGDENAKFQLAKILMRDEKGVPQDLPRSIELFEEFLDNAEKNPDLLLGIPGSMKAERLQAYLKAYIKEQDLANSDSLYTRINELLEDNDLTELLHKVGPMDYRNQLLAQCAEKRQREHPVSVPVDHTSEL